MTEIIQQLIKAEEAFKKGNLDEVLSILDDEGLSGNLQALFIKGETCYKLQKWGEALNYFLACSEKDPSNNSAKTYIEMIRNILGFRNTDFLNP
jgi:tetratricopeptide (TPR) repeat protein